MPYALYDGVLGSKIHNDDIGDLPAGTAVIIDERQRNIAKHLRNVVVFDKVAGIIEKKPIIKGIDMTTKSIKEVV